MFPVNSEWIGWLDDFGNMRSDAPIRIQKEYEEYMKELAKTYEEE